MFKAEVGHRARGRSYIERIARGHEHDIDEFGFGGQEMIVVPCSLPD
jgi:hypothetical protein